MHLCPLLVVAAAALVMCTFGAPPAASQPLDDAILVRSLVDRGDTTRIQHALAKARRGKPVTVAVIGGSITQGALASSADRCYGSRVAAWWRGRYPRAKVAFVNAGIGATGSDYGAQRAQRDLLTKRPDFVVVEYSVNDGNVQQSAETLEGLVRQILKQPQKPAVVLLSMMNDQGGNAQEWHSKVGQHYRLPMVSYRDALWPEIRDGRMERSVVFADVVHPNDRGHECAAAFVTYLLDYVSRGLPPDDRLPVIAPLPKPLYSDLFERVRLYDAGTLKPVVSEGWTLDPAAKCWRADRPGSVLEFEVPGRLVLVQTYRVRGPMGQARVQVDDAPSVTIDGWFDQTWGGYQPTTIAARDLRPGKHRVRIEVLPHKDAGSTGHEFKVFEIGVAGYPGR